MKHHEKHNLDLIDAMHKAAEEAKEFETFKTVFLLIMCCLVIAWLCISQVCANELLYLGEDMLMVEELEEHPFYHNDLAIEDV